MELKRYIKNKKGFTLIELVAIMVIIGILVLIAVPDYQKKVEYARGTKHIAMTNAIEEAVNEYTYNGEEDKLFNNPKEYIVIDNLSDKLIPSKDGGIKYRIFTASKEITTPKYKVDEYKSVFDKPNRNQIYRLLSDNIVQEVADNTDNQDMKDEVSGKVKNYYIVDRNNKVFKIVNTEYTDIKINNTKTISTTPSGTTSSTGEIVNPVWEK